MLSVHLFFFIPSLICLPTLSPKDSLQPPYLALDCSVLSCELVQLIFQGSNLFFQVNRLFAFPDRIGVFTPLKLFFQTNGSRVLPAPCISMLDGEYIGLSSPLSLPSLPGPTNPKQYSHWSYRLSSSSAWRVARFSSSASSCTRRNRSSSSSRDMVPTCRRRPADESLRAGETRNQYAGRLGRLICFSFCSCAAGLSDTQAFHFYGLP